MGISAFMVVLYLLLVYVPGIYSRLHAWTGTRGAIIVRCGPILPSRGNNNITRIWCLQSSHRVTSQDFPKLAQQMGNNTQKMLVLVFKHHSNTRTTQPDHKKQALKIYAGVGRKVPVALRLDFTLQSLGEIG